MEELVGPPQPSLPQRTESQRLRSILSGDHARKPALAEFTDDNFVAEVLDAKGLVVFDFWSRHCMQCALMLETMHRLADFFSRSKFGRVNTDRNPEIVKAFELKAIPHLVATINGDVVLEVVGDRPFEELRAKLEPFVAAASNPGSA